MTQKTGPSVATLLKPGFNDPIFDAQAVFRAAMISTAYPGRVVSLTTEIDGPLPFCKATAALSLTLMDFETPVWIDGQSRSDEATAWLRFHCGLPLTPDTATATYAVVTDPENMPSLADFHQGDIEYPERSTTLIIQVPSLTDGPTMRWTGPGINGSIITAIAGLPSWFWSLWDLNSELYPRGIDVIFTCGNMMVGLPRTILVNDSIGSAA
ncbi:phosphonate C-P lyase system protein PhnH [Microvirga sp. VF16]|uniref:phosphonate C-P lyase system protein PhnH n=1 Tax=Microvirga sp. VF16 TaxID=2807101 RepID=UPI00193D87D8|nr:phosphonate C-P lyase system protein PhnH [Microvirga sp. VF16]QRM32552.1 phosphonate C-P lyase system protein PhnH [Microvirga sp. VF16]